jgi:hypothetical protein
MYMTEISIKTYMYMYVYIYAYVFCNSKSLVLKSRHLVYSRQLSIQRIRRTPGGQTVLSPLTMHDGPPTVKF